MSAEPFSLFPASAAARPASRPHGRWVRALVCLSFLLGASASSFADAPEGPRAPEPGRTFVHGAGDVAQQVPATAWQATRGLRASTGAWVGGSFLLGGVAGFANDVAKQSYDKQGTGQSIDWARAGQAGALQGLASMFTPLYLRSLAKSIPEMVMMPRGMPLPVPRRFPPELVGFARRALLGAGITTFITEAVLELHDNNWDFKKVNWAAVTGAGVLAGAGAAAAPLLLAMFLPGLGPAAILTASLLGSVAGQYFGKALGGWISSLFPWGRRPAPADEARGPGVRLLGHDAVVAARPGHPQG